MTVTPAAFNSPVDICNVALQILGAPRIASFSDNSKNAAELAFAYDKKRRAELRRNCWRFSTRKSALRPLYGNTTWQVGMTTYTQPTLPNTGSLILTPAQWSSTVTYMPGSIVADPSGNGVIWTSLAQENLNNPPGETSSVWDIYFGPMAATPYDPTAGYWAGELVYIQDPNSQVIRVFRSLVNDNANSNILTISQTEGTETTNQTTTVTSTYNVYSSGLGNPWILTEWNPLVTYNRDQVIVYQFELYRSAIEQNSGNIPGSGSSYWLDCGPVTAPNLAVASNMNWLPINATVSSLIMDYPVGSGPAQEMSTRNAFLLPNGFLRKAPDDPKQGSVSWLGAPSALWYNDWLFEGNYITSRENVLILLRFIADVTNVSKMDDMFCEGLAARLAYDLCETLTQSTAKQAQALARYKQVMGEARIVNGIETSADQPAEDDYIMCRI